VGFPSDAIDNPFLVPHPQIKVSDLFLKEPFYPWKCSVVNGLRVGAHTVYPNSKHGLTHALDF